MNVHTALGRFSGTLLLLLALPAHAADTLAAWTFETTKPITAGPHAAEEGVGIARGFHTDPLAAYSNPVGNGSAESFSSTRWAIGDYYEFRLATTGYQDLLLSWDQARSGTGPALFDLAYSTNGTDFAVALPGYAVSTSSFSSGSVKPEFQVAADLGRIATLNNAPDVWLRLVASAEPSATVGASRVDNFKVTGSIFIPPATPLYWALPGGGTWDHAVENWTADADRAGPRRRFEASHTAILGGAGVEPRTIQIGAGGVAAEGGVRFDSAGYLVRGGALTLEGPNGRVTVTQPGDFATIDAPIRGGTGFWKAGDGTLVLGGANQFTGTVTITGGTLAVAATSALGSAANSLLLNRGTLRASATIDLGPRDLSGKGTLAVAAGARLSTSGAADFQELSIAGGEVEFLGAVARIAALTFREAASLRTAAGLQVGAGGVTAAQPSGTAWLHGGLDLEGATRPVFVADGISAIDLAITGTYRSSVGTGRYKLHKLGGGTLDLQAAGLDSAGLRIGVSGSDAAAVPGGSVRIGSAAALGGSTLELNYGTLEIAGPAGQPAPDLTGDSLAPLEVSLGGIEGGGAVSIRGGNIEFLGDLRLFKPSGATIEHTLELHNHTILSGSLRHTTNPASGAFSGLRLLGPGKLSLRSSSNDFSDLLVVDGPTLELSGALAANRVEVLRGTLSGRTADGTIGYYGDVTIGDDLPGTAYLSPGSRVATSNPIGMLVVKNLTLRSDAVVQLELNSDLATCDLISLLEGGLTIAPGAQLEISDLGTTVLSPGFELIIVELPSDLVPTGSFDRQVFAAGANVFEIFHSAGDGNDLVLRAIPEPASGLLAAAGAALALLWRQRGKP